MAKRKEIKAISYVPVNGTLVRFEDLSDEFREEFVRKKMQSLGATLSRYFSEHPEEAEPLLRKNQS